MDYESFKEKFVEDLKDRLDDQGADVKVSVNTVNKLNESYEAVTVTPEGSNIGVNIGIDKFYDAIDWSLLWHLFCRRLWRKVYGAMLQAYKTAKIGCYCTFFS